MKFYKIKHKPTGLFFKPSRYGSKSNLSKKGKVYNRRPTLRYLGEVYYHPYDGPRPDWSDQSRLATARRQGYEPRPVVENEWEIVEYVVEAVA